MKYLIFTFWISLLVSCSDKKQAAMFVDYNSTLDSISSIYSKPERGEYPIDLCLLFNNNLWDSIGFILPYLPIEDLDKMNLCNISFVRDTMKYVVGVEWNYGILFFKDNCITSYSVVGGNPSFGEIAGHYRPAIPILKRSDCKVKLINVPGENGVQSFYFVPLNYPTEEDRKGLEKYKEHPQPIDSLKL